MEGAALGPVEQHRRVLDLGEGLQVPRNLAVDPLLVVHGRIVQSHEDPVPLVFVKLVHMSGLLVC